MPEREIIDIDCELDGETEAAYRITQGDGYIWVPKSLCEWDKDDRRMTMPVWLAKDRGLV